ncbi:MAG: hypothetical protein IPM53_11045 [Anaerolineaceae bacterium]|nr:hypothetical protein [Anaerolineaceae bacterium]
MNIQLLIAQMTLEEKAALCTGASHWTTTPVVRLNIPEMIVSYGPHGVRRLSGKQLNTLQTRNNLGVGNGR